MGLFGKSTLPEKIVFSCAFAVFCASLFFLIAFNHYFAKAFVDPRDVIAKVVRVSNSVRRRTPIMFEFLDISISDPIGNGDTIFSGDHAIISMLFNDGSSLSIGENSLVVVRMIDGHLEIKVDKGKISAKIKKGLDVEIQSEEESVVVKGTRDTEFDLEYLPKLGLEMRNLSKAAAEPARKTGPSGEKETQKSQAANQTSVPAQEADQSPVSSRQKVMIMNPKGFQYDEDIKMKPKEFVPKTPYPADNTVVLHKGEFSLAIFPQPSCAGHCHLDIFLEGEKFIEKDFSPHNVPVLYIKIAKSTAGKLRWILTDNESKTSGQFEVLPYSEMNVANALKQKRPIEVAD
jgi:hypothetical protein